MGNTVNALLLALVDTGAGGFARALLDVDGGDGRARGKDFVGFERPAEFLALGDLRGSAEVEGKEGVVFLFSDDTTVPQLELNLRRREGRVGTLV